MQVYKARLDDVRDVAVKLLNPGTADADLTLQKFVREVNIMRACCDRNIVSLLGAWARHVSRAPSCSAHASKLCSICPHALLYR